MDDLSFKILGYVVSIAVLLVTGYVIPLIKAKVGEEKLNIIQDWVWRAVQAAEILYKGEPKAGKEKKQFVISFINKVVNSKKEVITESQIEILLESAVKMMHDSTVTTA